MRDRNETKLFSVKFFPVEIQINPEKQYRGLVWVVILLPQVLTH